MQCPSCQHTDSRVLESRSADSGRSVRRRRECLHCEFRFTTYERVETVPITVVKRNGSREAFNRSKLLHGLIRACEKTGLEPSRLETVVDELELQLQGRSGREVSSGEIGELVLLQLAEMSDVAYVRFASVYRQFQSVGDFVATLEGLKGADLDRYPGLIRACGGVRKGSRIDLHDAYHCFLGHAMVKKRLIALLHGFEIQFGLVIANPIPGSYLLPA